MRYLTALTCTALILCACGTKTAKPTAAGETMGEFKVLVSNPITPVKNQYRTKNCWCYAGISFLESEAIRKNNLKEEDYPDFAEMFLVSNELRERAVKYVRLRGNLRLWSGSEPEDVVRHLMPTHGLVPQEVMDGWVREGERDHKPLYQEVKDYADSVMATKGNHFNEWLPGLEAVIDSYLGHCPETFEWKGRTWTPAQYRDSFGLNPDDYVSFTSFTHHPFYTQFPMEVMDNWRWDMAWNLPLDEFMNVLYGALENGYTAAFASDTSEPGYDRQRRIFNYDGIPTQESRQEDFDRRLTTDDHAIHFFGIAEGPGGMKYLMVKDSHGPKGDFGGLDFMSDTYCRAKCVQFMVHKDAVPKALRKKLGI